MKAQKHTRVINENYEVDFIDSGSNITGAKIKGFVLGLNEAHQVDDDGYSEWLEKGVMSISLSMNNDDLNNLMQYLDEIKDIDYKENPEDLDVNVVDSIETMTKLTFNKY